MEIELSLVKDLILQPAILDFILYPVPWVKNDSLTFDFFLLKEMCAVTFS
jgi:hypothetical protein